MVTRIRNYFFDRGILASTSFKLPIIVVGNLNVGGTGKTPQIEYLIRLLKDNYRTAVLSRGYKRKTKGFVLLDDTHTALDVGDEPLQYFKKFKNVPIAVDADRVAGISKLIAQKQLDLVLLDDAFQHRRVAGSLYILLTKYNDLFVDDFLLPTGNLRESRIGASRAAVILVTKCPENLSAEAQYSVKRKLEHYNKKVFFTSIRYSDTVVSAYKKIKTSDLKDFEVLLITGIANPSPLLVYLKGLNVSYQHLEYPDHHHFSESEITTIHNKYEQISTAQKIILTTEKDFVRLVGSIASLYYLPIETTFLEDQAVAFQDFINKQLIEILQ